MSNIKIIFTIFKREVKSYFESPVAYVFMFFFLVLIGSLTFMSPWQSARLYERGIADMAPFFSWLPIVFLLLVPAATMGLWAEERKAGTIELLLTMPITITQAVIGKFLAAWTFITIGILLTFPTIATVAYLGDPDGGVIFCGYVGAILMAGGYVAVGMLASAITRSQVVSFVMSLTFCLVLVMAGTPFIIDFFSKWPAAAEAISSISFWTHFESIKRGVLDIGDLAYFAGVIVVLLFATQIVIDNRKSI